MREEKCGGSVIKFFDTPESMPMRRYRRFNKFLMVENEVGNDFADYEKRTQKAISFVKQGMIKEALQELSNRRQMVFNAFAEYSPRDRALAILVHSIDGVEYRDYSKTGLDEILNRLEEIGFTNKQSTEVVDEVKKKSKRNWRFTFLRSSKAQVQKSTPTN